VTAPKCGVVRGSLQYASGVVWGLYSRAEQITVVRTTLDLTKPFVPMVQPVVHRVVAVADPWVQSVDNVVTGAWQTVNSKVVEPSRDAQGNVSLNGVYTQVKQVATVELKNRYAALLDLSDHAVDVLLPETEEDKTEKKENEGAHAKSLVEVQSKAQRRMMKRLDGQLKNVRAFSAGRLKEIVHVDLMEYAENGFTLSVSLVQNTVNDLSARRVALTASAESVYVSIRTVSAEKSKLLWDAIARYRELSYQRYAEAYKFASHKADEFGVPMIVGKAKEVSLEEVSQFVLVKLNIKQQNEQYVVVERKLFDLFKTLIGLIISKDMNSKQKSAPADKPAAASIEAH